MCTMMRVVIRVGGRYRGRRARVRASLAVGVTAGLAVTGWAFVHGGLSAELVVAIVGGLLAVVFWLVQPPKRVQADDAELAAVHARTLARVVAEGESLVRRQLLGDDVRPVNLRFILQRAPSRGATAPPAGQAYAGEEMPLPDITAYYRATSPSRLVITGAAGAGKTVLALELLLALIADRGEHDPVPVRIPLIEWNISVPLRSLLIRRLTDAYKWPADSAANLVEHGLVLPVLDGLDEMDPTRPDGTPGPAALRTRAALEQLNSVQGRDGLRLLPLILTCRTDHYDALRHSDTLIDAARVSIAPVDAPTAAAYLGARARDPQRWQVLLHHLREHPGSHHALLLSTPWRLCLAATVYHHSGDPAELLQRATGSDLDAFLLARYIPAAARISGSHRYAPEQIHRWLHHLTTHLARSYGIRAAHNHLVLQLLRPPGGRALFRAADTILSLTPFALLYSVAQYAGAPPDAIYLVIFCAVLSAMGCVSGLPSTPSRIDLGQLSTSQVRRQLVSAVPTVLVAGLVFAFVGGPSSRLGLPAGYAVAIVYALTFSLTSTLTVDTSRAVRSRVVIRDDAIVGITAAVGWGCMAAVGFGRSDGLLSGIVCALAVALVMGFISGSTARRYTVFLLCSRRRLPFRLARFLDWACTAGLMRQSGPAYQFRHNELQTWITAHPEPTP